MMDEHKAYGYATTKSRTNEERMRGKISACDKNERVWRENEKN